MENKLLLYFMLLVSGVNVFTYSPFLDERYPYIDVSSWSKKYAEMHAGSSIINRGSAFVQEVLKITPKQEILSSSVIAAQPSLDNLQKQSKIPVEAKNSTTKNFNKNNFTAGATVKPVTVAVERKAVQEILMDKKVVFPLVALGGLKVAYDSLKSQEKQISDVQGITTIPGNNFKKMSAIGIAAAALVYGIYKVYYSDFFTKSKQVNEKKQ